MAGPIDSAQSAGPATRPANETSPENSNRDRSEAAPIDVEELAERVYRLMVADARLERVRRG